MYLLTRNSSADERANVNFLYDDIVHALGNKKEKEKTNSWAVVIIARNKVHFACGKLAAIVAVLAALAMLTAETRHLHILR